MLQLNKDQYLKSFVVIGRQSAKDLWLSFFPYRCDLIELAKLLPGKYYVDLTHLKLPTRINIYKPLNHSISSYFYLLTSTRQYAMMKDTRVLQTK